MTHVHSGDTVRVHYTLKLPDGTEFESSAGREPLQFQVGAGQIIPGLDSKVEGMAVGEKSTVTVPAAEAYGDRSEAAVQTVPRTPDGKQVPLTLVEIDDHNATIDANHPLAGQDLVFELEVVEVV